MNDDQKERWLLSISAGLITLVIGGAILYGVVEDDPQAGVLLVTGAFIVSLGTTLVYEEAKRIRKRRQHQRRGSRRDQ